MEEEDWEPTKAEKEMWRKAVAKEREELFPQRDICGVERQRQEALRSTMNEEWREWINREPDIIGRL